MHTDPASWPLVAQAEHHDACGVGFIATRHGLPTHRVLRLGVDCLRRLDHRGARAADGTGDGAGILTELPYRLLERELRARDIEPPSRDRLAVVSVFLPPNAADEARQLVNGALAYEDVEVLAWRTVPTDPQVLGDRARATMPLIEQVIVEVPGIDEDAVERHLFLARKYVERRARAENLEGFSIASASGRTIVYKGLFAASYIRDFYWDLRDPVYETRFAIFHQRYSTNTSPTWEMAQPFRTLAHNGEINTVRSNRAWMQAREVRGSSPIWGERARDLAPYLQPSQSDSASLDNAFELLLRSGRGLEHVNEMLIPSAWENVADMDPQLRAFYEYHAFMSEPWDGPAAIASTDGRSLLAGMDRNGLRPARWTLSPDVLLVASEAGVCPEEESAAVRTGQLGPGEAISIDSHTGEIRLPREVRDFLAKRFDYRDWISGETLYVQNPFVNSEDDLLDRTASARVFGYTAEDRRMLLQPMALGKTPTGSMGNDTPLAVLSPKPRRLSHYFHQLFAQVTNPPMDPIREKMVMSLRSYLGARGSLLEETQQQAALIELASPVISGAELDQIVRSGDPRFFSFWIATMWHPDGGPGEMRARLERLADDAVEAVRGGATSLKASTSCT